MNEQGARPVANKGAQVSQNKQSNFFYACHIAQSASQSYLRLLCLHWRGVWCESEPAIFNQINYQLGRLLASFNARLINYSAVHLTNLNKYQFQLKEQLQEEEGHPFKAKLAPRPLTHYLTPARKAEPLKMAQRLPTSQTSQGRTYAKVAPHEVVELQSVISEEEENILSTGGAIDEDGINHSIVYPSTIQSAKRKLVGSEETQAVQIVDTFSVVSGSDGDINTAAAFKQAVLGSHHQSSNQNNIFSRNQVEEVFRGNEAQQTVQHVTMPMTTESEDEVINFYSEGLSNHATSCYQRSFLEPHQPQAINSNAANNNQLTLMQSVPAYGSIYSQQSDQVLQQPGQPSVSNRLILVNSLRSDSTLYEGDTGGQRSKSKQNNALRLNNIGSQVPSQHHRRDQAVSLEGRRALETRPHMVDALNGQTHQRIRSQESQVAEQEILRPSKRRSQDQSTILPNQIQAASQRVCFEGVNRPRNDSSGGTHHKKNRENIHNADDCSPAVLVVTYEDTENQQLRRDLSKSVEDEYSPITLRQKSINSASQLQAHSPPYTLDTILLYELCRYLSQTTQTATQTHPSSNISTLLSKEERAKQNHLSQTVHSYYNKTSSSQTRSKQLLGQQVEAVASPSRQRQLLSYTVGNIAQHQQRRQAARSGDDSVRDPDFNTDFTTVIKPQTPPRIVPFTTPLTLERIFDCILEKSVPTLSAKEVSLRRKLAMWALCQIVAAPKPALQGLPVNLKTELTFFKDEIESNNPVGGGKLQLNPLPSVVKRMLQKDASVLTRMHENGYSLLDLDTRIWTFPKFTPIGALVKLTDQLNSYEAGHPSHLDFLLGKASPVRDHSPKSLASIPLAKFGEVFPDPQDYCIGVVCPELLPYNDQQQHLARSGEKSDEKNMLVDHQHLQSLDERIDRELRNEKPKLVGVVEASERQRSESPKWMQEERRSRRISQVYHERPSEEKQTMFPRPLQNSSNKKANNNSSHNHTMETYMEVPDEGIVDIKEFTDVDFASSSEAIKIKSKPRPGVNVSITTKGTKNGPPDKVKSNSKVQAKTTTTGTRKAKSRLQKKSSLSTKVPSLYGQAPSRLNDNWQRSVTAINKHHVTPTSGGPPFMVKSTLNSGRKTTATKLSYAYNPTSMVDKRSKEEFHSGSFTAMSNGGAAAVSSTTQRKMTQQAHAQGKTSLNLTQTMQSSSYAKKNNMSLLDPKQVNQDRLAPSQTYHQTMTSATPTPQMTRKHLTQRLALRHLTKANDFSAAGTATPASSSRKITPAASKQETAMKAQSSRNNTGKVLQGGVSAQQTGAQSSIVAHHARSFAITTSKQASSSLVRPNTTGTESTTMATINKTRRQGNATMVAYASNTIAGSVTARGGQQSQPFNTTSGSAVQRETWSPRSGSNSNSKDYRLTQQLPSAQQRSQAKQASAGTSAAAVGGATQQQQKVGRGTPATTQSRAKTSLESQLMSRVMAATSPRETQQPRPTTSTIEDKKAGLHQAMIISSRQRRRPTDNSNAATTADKAVKLSNVMEMPASTSARSTRKRKPDSLYSGAPAVGYLKPNSTLQLTERRTKNQRSSRNNAHKTIDTSTLGAGKSSGKAPREISLSMSAQKIQENLETKATVQSSKAKTGVKRSALSKKRVADKGSRASSQTSIQLQDQVDEDTVVMHSVPASKSKPGKLQKPGGVSKSNLNTQIQAKLNLNDRISSTPGSKFNGSTGKSSLAKHRIMAAPTQSDQSTTFGALSTRQNSNQKPIGYNPVYSSNALTQSGKGFSQFTHQNVSSSAGSGLGMVTPTPPRKHNLRQLLQPAGQETVGSRQSLTRGQQRTSSQSSSHKLSARSTTGGQPSSGVVNSATLTKKTFIQLF